MALNCSGRRAACLDTDPKGLSLSQCDQAPRWDKQDCHRQKAPSGSHLVTGLLLFGEKHLPLLGTGPFCLPAGRSGTAHEVPRGRAQQEPEGTRCAPEASLAVVVVLFSAVVLIWLWALCWRSC